MNQGFNRSSRALCCTGLDDFPNQHKERDNTCCLVVAGGKGRQHGNGHQFIDAKQSQTQIGDGRANDGNAKNQGTDETTRCGDGVTGGKHPVHHERVEHKHHADERLLQLNLSVGMLHTTCSATPAILMMMVVMIMLLAAD